MKNLRHSNFTFLLLIGLTLGRSAQAAPGQACADAGTASGSGCPPPAGTCLSYVDLIAYFVPSYSGWQTAKLTEEYTVPSVSTTFYRKYLYDTGKLAVIKFNDPHSVET